MATTQLDPVVAQGRELRPIETGIWTAFSDAFEGAPFDLRAMAIDAAASVPTYHRLAWGVSTDSLLAFANDAFTKDNQPYLDAGCGTMRFTAHVYAEVDLPLTAVDTSLGAMRRARDRVLAIAGDAPNRIAFVQADLTDLPFPDGSYETILCMDRLHHYADAARLLASLVRVLQPGGELYLTSLASADRPWGEKLAKFLLEKGEIAAWRDPDDIKALITVTGLHLVSFWTEGNMAFAWAVKPL